jgi:hypothetical protein
VIIFQYGNVDVLRDVPVTMLAPPVHQLTTNGGITKSVWLKSIILVAIFVPQPNALPIGTA